MSRVADGLPVQVRPRMDAFFNNMGEKLKEALPVLGIKLEEEEGKREKFAPFERPRSVLKSRGGSKSPVRSAILDAHAM